MQLSKINFKKIVAVVALAIAVFFFYETWCPIEQIIGIPCPGCNMFTALYHLLHGDVHVALFFHPLVIVFCIYAILEAVLYLKYRHLKSKQAFYLRIVFFTLLGVVYIYRMITIYPQYPMVYNENSILWKIISLFK